MIRITGTFKKGSPPKGNPRKYMTIAAGICLRIMHELVDKGVDIYGSAYKKYSESYFEWKKKKGRSPETAGDWLTFTGQMLASHKPVIVTDREFVLGFSGTRSDTQASNALIAYANNKVRKFVGLSLENKEKARQELKKEVGPPY